MEVVNVSDGLISGHVLLADWLWLIAAVVLAVASVDAIRPMVGTARGWLVPIGLTLLAIGWLVL